MASQLDTPAPRRQRGTLDPDEIVDHAIGLITADGIDAFSMRRLATALGVTPMTIYLRFENKDELLAAVARRMLGRFEAPEITGTWSDRVVAFAVAVRDHIERARPVLGVLGTSEGLGQAMADATDAGLALMADIGFEGGDAVAAYRILFWHAVGAVMVRDTIDTDPVAHIRGRFTSPDHPHLDALIGHFGKPDPDQIFRDATLALAAGLAARSPHIESPQGASS